MKKTRQKASTSSRPKSLPLKKQVPEQIKGGRKTSVKDAHDKYANLKTEY